MNKGADVPAAGDRRVGGTKGGVGKAWIVHTRFFQLGSAVRGLKKGFESCILINILSTISTYYLPPYLTSFEASAVSLAPQIPAVSSFGLSLNHSSNTL